MTNAMILDFVGQLYNQEADYVDKNGVDFILYEDKAVDTTATPPPGLKELPVGAEREVMLYLPGLEFSGVSGCGQFPAMSSRFELWRTRVGPDDRNCFDELVDSVVAFIEGEVVVGR